MTVGEAIELLSKYPPGLRVVLPRSAPGADGVRCDDAAEARMVRVRFGDASPWDLPGRHEEDARGVPAVMLR